jgi:hypothetical protein
MRKISHDIGLLTTDNLFAHLVDESLAFHRELHGKYDYPEAFPGCLHVLVESEPFRRWISIEKKCILSRVMWIYFIM